MALSNYSIFSHSLINFKSNITFENICVKWQVNRKLKSLVLYISFGCS